MPGMNGIKFIKEVRKLPNYKYVGLNAFHDSGSIVIERHQAARRPVPASRASPARRFLAAARLP